MRFPIGAMSVGDILDRGLKVLLARLPTFYAINLIALSPIILLQLVQPQLASVGTQPGQSGPFADSSLVGVAIGVGLATFVLTIILSQIGNAAVLHIIAQEFVDQRVGLGQALRFALHRFGRLLGAAILAGLTIGLGFVLCIAPGIIFAIWYVFVSQVVVVEGLKAEKAMSRSKELTSGYRGRILGILVLCIAISMVFQASAGLLQRVLPMQEMVRTDFGYTTVFIYRNYVINVLVTQMVNILVQTYLAVCITLLYFDIRIRKEGFDLELAAQQQSPVTP
jgi:hypothetical protein